MSSNKISLQANLQSSLVIWSSLVLGQIFFGAISVYLVKYGGMNIDQPELYQILIYVVPIIAIVSVLLSFYIFNQRLVALKDKTDLNSKLFDYRSALIVRWALLEGPSFFAIVSYILTGNYILLSIAVVIIIIFILLMPNRARFEKELELNWEENNLLDD